MTMPAMTHTHLMERVETHPKVGECVFAMNGCIKMHTDAFNKIQSLSDACSVLNDFMACSFKNCPLAAEVRGSMIHIINFVMDTLDTGCHVDNSQSSIQKPASWTISLVLMVIIAFLIIVLI
ncbi:hypothetical protein PoB_001687200 [Plakobranchus ocellatus]|uniref:Uncharacterized protein n=1 Tax=Plakobranchus ocellatus TaxID=259542 RepID=A0AAV3Z764_9GAST|nr:hypothetical protein PoB_001687200 [Plakobranchus ocellatus]